MDNTDSPVWFITGCSSGFGRELAKLILQRGWKTVITAGNVDQVKDIAEGNENTEMVLSLHVNMKDQVSSAVAKAEETFGRTDVFVNNAGYGYFSGTEMTLAFNQQF